MNKASIQNLAPAERKRLLESLKSSNLTRTPSQPQTPINRVDRSTAIPLSIAQQRLWFLAQMDGVSEVYHIAAGVQLHGELNRTALQRALDRIVARHEALRTCFSQVDGQVLQIIGSADIGMRIAYHDLRHSTDHDAQLQALCELESCASFDLEHGPLIRGRLIQTGAHEHVLLLTMHHIVSDGWSMGVLIKEFSTLYGAYSQGGDDPLAPLAIQYADYAVWQRETLAATASQHHVDYWKQALSGAPALLDLPTDRVRPKQQRFEGGYVGITLDASLTQRLNALSQRHGVTLYMTVLASWAVLLARLSGQDNLVIGSPTAGRSRLELEPLIGFFINTLALRFDLSAEPTVAELLTLTRQQVLAAQRHQDLPFEQIVDIVKPTRSMAHTPLFQVMFSWQNSPGGTLELPGVSLSPLSIATATMAKFELAVSMQEAGDIIAGNMQYATSLFDHATIERHVSQWHTLLEAMVSDDELAITHTPLLKLAANEQKRKGPVAKSSFHLDLDEMEATLAAAALPLRDSGVAEVRAEYHYTAPEGETEQILAAIWGELLQQERVGRHDNFFELGGHSLLAINLIERMRRVGVKTNVRALFTTPTIAQLACAGVTETAGLSVPKNLIPSGCELITPDMVTLADVSEQQLAAIIATVDGGASNIQDIYPLAPLQEGILFHHLMNDTGDTYLQPMLIEFSDRERLEAFTQALQVVVNRHDILRTCMRWEGLSAPLQVVLRQASYVVEMIDLNPQNGDIGAQLKARFDPRRYRIDLRQAPLMRGLVAYDAANDRWLMQFLTHHLVSDHTTLELLIEEIEAILGGRHDTLPEPLPFRNFVAHARLGVTQQEHEHFFRGMLGDIDETTAPFGLIDVQGDGSAIVQASCMVEPALAWRIRRSTRRLGVGAASLMHLAWAKVLAAVSNRTDVVFGTVLFGRMQGSADIGSVLGMFINTLPIRISAGAVGVEQSLRDTHVLLTELMRHEHASLALAQRCSGVAAPAPLFSALFNYRHAVGAAGNSHAKDPAAAQQVWEGIRVLGSSERTNYPFGLSVDDFGEGFGLTALVKAGVNAQGICTYMHTALEHLVQALENAPETPLHDLPILPSAERTLLLEQWNDTAVDYPKTATIHRLFEEQAVATPEHIALVFEGAQLTYAELNAKANRLAHYLRGAGVGPDVLVGLCIERSLEMIVALLAVLKAGGAYVPLDPAYPEERLAYILEDAAPAILLTQQHLQAGLPASGIPQLCLDSQWESVQACSPENLPLAVRPDNLAYVIYTSGSTGKPKGVLTLHRGVVNLALSHINNIYRPLAGTTKLRTSFNASYVFDASVSELILLLDGHTLFIVPERVRLAPGALLDFMEENRLDAFDSSPAQLKYLLDHGGAERLPGIVLFGGEAISPGLWQQLAGITKTQFFNAYGPTESTIDVALFPVAAGSSLPLIGRPEANTQLYLLDASLQPVPLGVTGELYIAGDGLARGYLNRAALTAEKFLPNPFSTTPGARMYASGDLARYTPVGELEYLGRADTQVKIRGYRIEPGEIETALASLAQIRDVAVLAREDIPGDIRLVAYVVANEEHAFPTASELRDALRRTLPDHMIPGHFMQVAHLPLTASGKLDRKALPAPGMASNTAHYTAPRNFTEETLVQIWAETLKLDKVGIHDNFFELGGPFATGNYAHRTHAKHRLVGGCTHLVRHADDRRSCRKSWRKEYRSRSAAQSHSRVF